jgi:hypothetical protein
MWVPLAPREGEGILGVQEIWVIDREENGKFRGKRIMEARYAPLTSIED